jgi:hypothetical protein
MRENVAKAWRWRRQRIPIIGDSISIFEIGQLSAFQRGGVAVAQNYGDLPIIRQ